jgi:hypothetical protein
MERPHPKGKSFSSKNKARTGWQSQSLVTGTALSITPNPIGDGAWLPRLIDAPVIYGNELAPACPRPHFSSAAAYCPAAALPRSI